MSSHNPNIDQPVESTDSAEARMRLALGLGSRPGGSAQAATTPSPAPSSHDPSRQRRRFAQDGDVPVVMLHRGRDGDAGGENKLAVLSAELREERAARLKVERALEEANTLSLSLRTKLKHAEMALEERQRGDDGARTQANALLAAEREARLHAESRAAEAALALSMLERKIETGAKPPTVTAPSVQPAPAEPAAQTTADLFGDRQAATTPRRRSGKKVEAEPEAADTAEDSTDKPIEWWLPSFRATRKVPIRRKRATS